MADEPDPKGAQPPVSTTLQRKALEALTFEDMGEFVRQVEARSLERLFFDLPALVRLPEATFNLVGVALRRRIKSASAEERRVITGMLETLRDNAETDDVRSRCEKLLSRLD
jgi:hypothetical protein